MTDEAAEKNLKYRGELILLARRLLADAMDRIADARTLAERTRQQAGLIVAEIDDETAAAACPV